MDDAAGRAPAGLSELSGDAPARRVIPLRRRWVDWVLIAFFAVNLFFITYFIDIEQLTVANPAHYHYPAWPPAAIVNLVHSYRHHYDPLLMARPAFWRMTIWIDVLWNGPFYVAAMYALARGREWIRVPALIWSGSMSAVVLIILAEEHSGIHRSPHFGFVLLLNLPWLALPVATIIRMARHQRISYVPLDQMDEAMRAEMERCAQEGTPRPESSAVRAHVPACFWFFARSWDDIFRHGVVDHRLKELCRVYISRSVNCEYCGNQRSVQAAEQGLTEGKYDELLNFEKSARYSDREKAALAYAEAIAWKLPTDDAFWERMHRHFSEPELVELGCAIGLTFGQQSWLRMLNIGHHEVMPGTDASLAPGFTTPEQAAATMASDGYWAKR